MLLVLNYILHPHSCPLKKREKSQFYFQIPLRKQYKWTISLHFDDPWVLVFQYFVWQNGKHTKSIAVYQSRGIISRRSTYTIIWVVIICNNGTFHMKNWLMGKMYLFGIENLADSSSKINKVNLPCQGKQWITFLANGKIWAFKRKLEF